MEIFAKKINFPCDPSTLYGLLAEAQSLSSATGYKAKGDVVPGTAFSAGDGAFKGTTLHAERDRLIVRSWRGAEWPKTEPDSILVLRFQASEKGSGLYVALSGIPDGASSSAKSDLNKYFWSPIKAHLKALYAAANPPRPRGRPRKAPAAADAEPAQPKPRGRPGKGSRVKPAQQAEGAKAPRSRGRPAKGAAPKAEGGKRKR